MEELSTPFLYNSQSQNPHILVKSPQFWYILGSPKPLMENSVRHILIILSIILFSSPLFGQSKDDCYLTVVGVKEKDKLVIDQIVRPLLSSFISP